jgi:hypothetical protein
MANEEQLALLKAGVKGWNKWREEEPDTRVDLTKADLTNADLRGADLFGVNLDVADLRRADLTHAYLRGANLSGANLEAANFYRADLRETNLGGANLSGGYLEAANFYGANLQGANLRSADLSRADLNSTDLREADLRSAKLIKTSLVGTIISNAKISKAHVYGVNVWDLYGEFKEQKDLIITPEDASPITVDNMKVAQFVYLILNNKEIRDVINTLTSKSVLILGRFALPERKKILDALRDKLREYDLLPIVFDFDRPADKDFTETIKTLAGLCYFVIADVTNPKSSPLELQATIPDYQIPFVPIIQKGEEPFAMMVDLQKKYNWVLETRTYSSKETLIGALRKGIIEPAMQKHNELRLIKAQQPDTVSLDDLED